MKKLGVEMKKLPSVFLTAAVLALGASGLAWSDHDDDRHDHRGKREREGWFARGDLAAATNPVYREECGSCHLAYPPGLLPAAAWQQVMGGLDRHFGDDATLEPAVADELLAYLTANGGDRSARVRPRAFAVRTGADGEPPRITASAYFQRKHDEVPARYVRDNPKVRSFSNCQLCHAGAERGDFNEHRVNIPGVGRFED